jgi:hypothetical protein
MDKKEIIERLRNDEDYYGEFGQQYLSNSNVSTLLNNPLALGKPQKQIPAFLVGGYFHTAILEPEKIKNFKVIDASNRNTKAYKEMSGGEMCILQSEVDLVDKMTDKILSNTVCHDLIRGNCTYEVPNIGEIENELWKGKADILNHDEKLIIDLKTTADIQGFKYSANKYNYDSQAYIYQELFGYEMIFMAIDKQTHQIGIFDCSPAFIKRGADKVAKAVEQYQLFFQQEGFDPKQFFTQTTL